MNIRETFEKWYTTTYWDFQNHGVSYDETNSRYNHFDVDLAWNAWKASYDSVKDKIWQEFTIKTF